MEGKSIGEKGKGDTIHDSTNFCKDDNVVSFNAKHLGDHKLLLNGKITLEIVQGRLADQDTDAITNAANECLDHAGGLAERIAQTGGLTINLESEDWIKKHGIVPTGTCAWTKAGKLPSKFVIHAVGPMYNKQRH